MAAVRITIVASGSGGNVTLIEGGGVRVLVDAGVGPRTLTTLLERAGNQGAPPSALVITHAHSDHVGHYRPLARRFGLRVYMSEATARAVEPPSTVDVKRFSPREPFAIGGLNVFPTPLPHDAAQVALVFEAGGLRAGLATDLGEVPPGLPEAFAACDLLLLESNHDMTMLREGPYPLHLKRRIASAKGHLSNAQAAELLRALPPRARAVVLMHLSRTNNAPALALASAHAALAGRHVRLFVAPPRGPLSFDVAAPPPAFPLVWPTGPNAPDEPSPPVAPPRPRGASAPAPATRPGPGKQLSLPF
jgi:phosphoribosyl 1,2-cyclic phosphodiesterase